MRCLDLLRQTIPFSKLPEGVIKHVCEVSSRSSFSKGDYIFREQDEFKGCLMVVASGLVELNIKKDREIILGYRGEGDLLGEDAFVSKKPYRYNAVCIEDAQVLFVPADVLEQVGRKYPEVYSSIASLLSHRLEVFYRETQELPDSRHIPSFFKKRIGEVFRYRRPVFVKEDDSVKDVAVKMVENSATAVLVKGKRELAGIITEHDVVVHVARGEGEKAGDIMSRNVIKKSPQDLCYEAAIEMIRNRIKHIVVEDEGKIVGILNILDLMEHETFTYINVLTEISEA